LLEYAERLPGIPVEDLQRLASISHWLRKEREFSFYGDVDFIPTGQYTREDALRAKDDAQFVVETSSRIILLPNEQS
jgi:hypothetical protein